MYVSGNAAKVRVELIREIGSRMLAGLRTKTERVYAEMKDWLGGAFLQEMHG